MREIIFRGKISEKAHQFEKMFDKWTEGHLNINGYGNYEIVRTQCNNVGLEGFEVDADTVGQYTGLKDKNGTKIFEWDIIKYHDITGVVKFEYCFYIQWENSFGCTSILPVSDRMTLEIIGNIYDNKELLKGERNENRR